MDIPEEPDARTASLSDLYAQCNDEDKAYTQRRQRGFGTLAHISLHDVHFCATNYGVRHDQGVRGERAEDAPRTASQKKIFLEGMKLWKCRIKDKYSSLNSHGTN